MAIDEINKIDYIRISLKDNKVLILGIEDNYYNYKYLEQTENQHLYLLQEKINTCSKYVTSKLYNNEFPNKTFDRFLIQIEFSYNITRECYNFLIRAKKLLKKANINITARYIKYRRKTFFK